MSVCPSVCPSITSRYCIKTAKRRISRQTPHDSPGTLVLRCKRSQRNSDGITPNGGGANAGGVIRPVEKSPAQPPYCRKFVHPLRWSRPRLCAGGGICRVINNFRGSRSLMITQLRSSWHQQGWLYENLLTTRTASHRAYSLCDSWAMQRTMQVAE